MDICPHSEFCGGCFYQGVPYEEQLRDKETQVLERLKQAEIEPEQYLGIVPAPAPYRYRNKMEYTFGDMEKGGEMTLGMHRRRHFMSVVTVDRCQLVPEDFNRILSSVLGFCREQGCSHYNKKSHQGLMRNLVVRKGIHTGEILVAAVTTSEPGFDEQGFVELIRDIPDLDGSVVGILRIMNDGLADAVNCDELRTLWGRPYYKETILGLEFQVGILSFFQTNVSAVERLYTDALHMIDDPEGKEVFDLFCGTGTITQALARRARHVVGVEIVPEAVRMARESTARNGLTNCDFLEGDVFAVLDRIKEKPDVICVDPPRGGIHPKALDKILAYGVDQILYISCNYKTLAENAVQMRRAGYQMESLRIYDNFPFTRHIETCCLLRKRAEGEA